MGIFPPGAFVRLKNGETAVVVGRSNEPTCPKIRSVLATCGTPYTVAPERDPGKEEFAIVSMVSRSGPRHMSSRLSRIWPDIEFSEIKRGLDELAQDLLQHGFDHCASA